VAHVEDRWFRPKRDADGTVVLNGRRRPVMEPTELHGSGLRYRVRYIAPDGRERSKSFPDRAKADAEAFLVTVESDKLRGSYVDPRAGRIAFEEYAENWLRTRVLDESSREATEYRVRKHLLPFFGPRPLASIKPGHVREWDSSLVGVLAPSTRAVVFTHLRSILGAAVDDELIAKNPCSAKSVQQARPVERKVVPWKVSEVSAIRAGLAERYRPIVDLGAGCGMRQGEIFGLAVGDVDTADGWVHVQRQLKRVRSRLVFGLPKNDKDRRVPLPATVAESIKAHLQAVEPVDVTLPWEDPAGDKKITVRLIFTSGRSGAINRSTFDAKSWHPALRSAGIVPTRATGMHALRHFYASALLDGGESIKALAEYLGHHDPGFTLRVYTHLMPASEERTRRAIDAVFTGGLQPPDGLATA
jgi:integrase